ncbi:hypothetical protein SHKM778_63980 [Streptomyces sp. KM77-8]|uniref:Uncharacterized protein n=1 Tax=Streptomyces haneummycinicus TaxID=3074435 RepID=A0AAT9HR33_9ACTN
MLDPAVDDAGGGHAVAYGVQAALHLRRHARGQLRQEFLELGGGEAADHLVGVRPVLVESLDVREDHERFGAQCSSECRSRRISIDVVDMVVVLAAGDRGDDGDAAVGEQCLDRARVDRGDLAHPPDVDRFSVDRGAVPGGGEGVRVLAGETDGERSVPVEQSDQLPLHLSGEHHAYDVHGVLGGDAQAGLELADDAVPVEGGADLRSAAVHDDGFEAGVPQEDDVLREGGLQLLVDHGVAAELDDDGLAVVPGQPGQRLDEDLCLGQRGVLPRGSVAHEAYALFSWT